MSTNRNRRVVLRVEELEKRLAPAYLVSAPGAFNNPPLFNIPGADAGYSISAASRVTDSMFNAAGDWRKTERIGPAEVLSPTPEEWLYLDVMYGIFYWNDPWTFTQSGQSLADNSLEIRNSEAFCPPAPAGAGHIGGRGRAGEVAASLALRYNRNGVDPADIHWIEFIHTNLPLGGASELSIAVTPNNTTTPFYDTGGAANDQGFYQLSRRTLNTIAGAGGPGFTDFYWYANLFVVEQTGPRTGVIWGGVTWGYSTPAQTVLMASLSTSANPSSVGNNVTFSTTLTGNLPNDPVPTGSVSFYSDGLYLGVGTVDSSGNATLNTTTLTAGTHNITAVYSGDDEYATITKSLSQTVNASSGGSGGSIGNFVWNDLNQNGVQDGAELGIGGVTVHLLDGFGGLLATTITSYSGHYVFNNLAAGNYQIRVVAPANYQFTSRYQGTNSALDSNTDTLGYTGVFSLSLNQQLTDIDAGLFWSSGGMP